LVDKHVDIKLRLKLFDSVVTPSALHGLSPAPLTKHDLEALATTQRKMFRAIVGCAQLRNDDWADFHRRVNSKISAGLSRHFVAGWDPEVLTRKEALLHKLSESSCNPLVKRVVDWIPSSTFDSKRVYNAHRTPGRPCTSWDEHVKQVEVHS